MTLRLTETGEWRALRAHYEKIKDIHLRQLFAQDSSRGGRLTAEGAGKDVNGSSLASAKKDFAQAAMAIAREQDVPLTSVTAGLRSERVGTALLTNILSASRSQD